MESDANKTEKPTMAKIIDKTPTQTVIFRAFSDIFRDFDLFAAHKQVDFSN